MTFETDGHVSVTLVSRPLGLRITGEMDYGNRHLLAGALEWAILAGDEDIRLDLSGVTFIDVAGLRAIVHAAARLRPGRRLVLTPVSAPVRRLLALTGWYDVPGLYVRRH